jgi:fluoride ion exporter CrcB/FEX
VTTPELVDKALDFLRAGVLASFGAMAKYLYDSTTTDKKFTWGMFAANIFIAFFVGKLVGEFIDPAHQYRDGMIMVAGYGSYPFLAWLEVTIRKKLDNTHV